MQGSAARTGKQRLQPAYKIDTSLVNPLGFLPEVSKPSFGTGGDLIVPTWQPRQADSANPSNLAVRNLLRGNGMGLPSGQAVAKALGEVPLGADDLVAGKAQMNDSGSPDDVPLNGIAAGRFVDEAPLWYYVLAEANAQWRRQAAG
jgi:hypothetical protein